jgi:Raf kinase inhibitor-like YbhB/YbcL family protein
VAAVAFAAAGAGPLGAQGHLTVTSSAFTDGATIPAPYAYRGCATGAVNRSPALSWHGAPAGTKSFAITMFDPDAPTGHGFWHWVMFDIAPGTRALEAGAGAKDAAPGGAVLGHIDFGSSAYGGPCPPPGDRPHHYIVTVRALDVAHLSGGTPATTGPELTAAVAGHVIAQGTLTGRFGR